MALSIGPGFSIYLAEVIGLYPVKPSSMLCESKSRCNRHVVPDNYPFRLKMTKRSTADKIEQQKEEEAHRDRNRQSQNPGHCNTDHGFLLEILDSSRCYHPSRYSGRQYVCGTHGQVKEGGKADGGSSSKIGCGSFGKGKM